MSACKKRTPWCKQQRQSLNWWQVVLHRPSWSIEPNIHIPLHVAQLPCMDCLYCFRVLPCSTASWLLSSHGWLLGLKMDGPTLGFHRFHVSEPAVTAVRLSFDHDEWKTTTFRYLSYAWDLQCLWHSRSWRFQLCSCGYLTAHKHHHFQSEKLSSKLTNLLPPC
jgi:hypothetical protein